MLQDESNTPNCYWQREKQSLFQCLIRNTYRNVTLLVLLFVQTI